MTIPFVKMQGLGNDFVVIDRRDAGAPISPAQAIAICDRHFGVGADGVLSILRSERAPLSMHVTNADGSIAEMCGNGIRCVVRYAIDRSLIDRKGAPIETGRGVLTCIAEENGDVRVDMGAADVRPDEIAFPIALGANKFAVTAVSMGNPHAVVFLENGQNPVEFTHRFGPELGKQARFPKQTNAEFALVRSPREIDLAVWERGAGFTHACGTGACATAAAAVLTKRSVAGETIRVNLRGGALQILVEPNLLHVWMSGPAIEVFRGELR